MPISLQNVDDNYMILHCEDEVGADDFVQANDRIYSEVDERIARFQIVDLTAATYVVMAEADIRRIAAQDKKAVDFLGHIAIAVVASQHYVYELSCIWKVFSLTPQIRTMIFTDLASAQEWILRLRSKET